MAILVFFCLLLQSKQLPLLLFKPQGGFCCVGPVAEQIKAYSGQRKLSLRILYTRVETLLSISDKGKGQEEKHHHIWTLFFSILL